MVGIYENYIELKNECMENPSNYYMGYIRGLFDTNNLTRKQLDELEDIIENSNYYREG